MMRIAMLLYYSNDWVSLIYLFLSFGYMAHVFN